MYNIKLCAQIQISTHQAVKWEKIGHHQSCLITNIHYHETTNTSEEEKRGYMYNTNAIVFQSTKTENRYNSCLEWIIWVNH